MKSRAAIKCFSTSARPAFLRRKSGKVDAGIVYKTEAAISKKVKVAYGVPAKESPNISYPAAAIKESNNAEAVKRFIEHLASEKASKVFEPFGFVARK